MENIRSSYKTYKAKVENPVDFKTYIHLAADYAKFLIEKVLEGEQITLPARLGTLAITGKKQKVTVDEEGNIKGAAPSWHKTKLLRENNEQANANKKVVYCTNDHTNKVRYKFLWSKKNVPFLNKSLYSLRMTKPNKTAASKLIKSGKEYIHN